MKNKSRFKIARVILIFWCLFIGIGALGGGIAMLIKPDGSLLQMQNVLKYFEVLPFSDVLFQDYFFSGIALIIVNGITNIVATILLLKKKKSGIILGGVFGITLMLWICIQFYMFPKEIIQLSLTYFIFGIFQAITGYSAWVFYNQETFCINENEYKNIGKNQKELVVYFSRLGYTKKVAYEEAERLNAEIYEIKTQEPTSGTSGFWWCGYFASTGKDMTIDEINIDLTKYDHVTICSPIWVFDICNPIKSFCKQSKGKIKSVSYILVHYTNLKYKITVEKMDKILGIKHKTITNIICRIGKMKRVIK